MARREKGVPCRTANTTRLIMKVTTTTRIPMKKIKVEELRKCNKPFPGTIGGYTKGVFRHLGAVIVPVMVLGVAVNRFTDPRLDFKTI